MAELILQLCGQARHVLELHSPSLGVEVEGAVAVAMSKAEMLFTARQRTRIVAHATGPST